MTQRILVCQLGVTQEITSADYADYTDSINVLCKEYSGNLRNRRNLRMRF